jgi:hypothetical protein
LELRRQQHLRRLTVLSLLLAASSTAWAALPLVYDAGTPAEAVATAVAGTGLPADQFEPRPVSAVLTASARAFRGGTLRHCAGAPTRGPDLRAHAVRAEAAWREGDAAGALDQLDLGIAALGCLTERVEPAVAARMFLLRGGLFARNGDAGAAKAELQTALALDPEAAWSASLPPDGAPLLDLVRAVAEDAPVDVLPAVRSAGPWLDGHDPVDGGFSVRPGLHLLQAPSTAGLQTAWLTVEAGATVVLPSGYRGAVLPMLGDAAARPEVERLLQTTLGAPAAYVVSGGGVWLVTFDGDAPVTEQLVAPPVEDVGKKRRRKQRP